MNLHIIVKIVIIAMVLLSQEAEAQIGPPPGNNSNIPLDPMSWTLLGAGAAYAANKYRKGKKDEL